MQRSLIEDTRGDRIFMAFNYLVLIALLVTILYPLIYIVSASLSASRIAAL